MIKLTLRVIVNTPSINIPDAYDIISHKYTKMTINDNPGIPGLVLS